jgi:hypothetical protein
MDDMQAGGGGEPEPGGARTSPIVLGLLCGFFFPLLPLFFLKAPPPPHAWPADAPPSVIFSCVRRALALVGVRADRRGAGGGCRSGSCWAWGRTCCLRRGGR